MGRVRSFAPDDIPQVADLSWSLLFGREGSPPLELEEYFQQLFFLSPWSDSNLPSLVYQDDRGMIVGFLGVVARRMWLKSTPLRVAFGSNFIVHPLSRTTPAGLQLVRAFFAGGQDLSLSDTANHTSQTIWAGFGGSTAAMYDIHWSRPLRPSQYALHAASRFGKGSLSPALTRCFRPFCKVVDSVITKIPPVTVRQPAPSLMAEELDVDTLLESLSASWPGYSLRPDGDRQSTSWLLDFMRQMKAYGDLRRVALRDDRGKLAGCYIYYEKRDGIGEVVHVGAPVRSISTVLDYLFHDAFTRGAIALHGRLDIRSSRQLAGKFCFFFNGSDPLLVHSRNPELTRLFQTGDALFTRLDGEWCLKFGVDSKPGNSSNEVQNYRDNVNARHFHPSRSQHYEARTH